jgi:SSS family solute:Na+ symporter
MEALIFTTPEFIEKRFNKHIRTYLASLTLVIYIFTKISVTIYAGAILIDVVLGWNLWISAALIMVSTGVYTVFGGLSAVIYTEVLQTVVLLFGAVTLAILAFIQVGGLPNFINERPDYFHLFKPVQDKEFPWTGVLLGMPTSGIWYWCSDQVIVQRVLAAKNEGHAKTGCIMAAFIKISVMFVFVMPGCVAGQLFPAEIAKDSNIAFPLLVRELMPPVLKGIMVAAMLAAAMSSLAGVFSSASTIFTMDVYQRIRKNGGQTELVLVGKIATGILVVCSLAWLPFIPMMSDQLYVYIQSVSSYTAPPITAMFLMGCLWRGTTSTAAMISLASGFVFGALRFVMEIIFKGRSDGNAFIYVFADMNYLHFSIILFWVTVLQLLIFSLLTPKSWRNENIDQYTIQYKKFFANSCGWLIPKRYTRMQEETEQEVPATETELTDVPKPEEQQDQVTQPEPTEDLNTATHDEDTLHDVNLTIEPEPVPTIEPEPELPITNDEEQLKKVREISGFHKYSSLSIPILLAIMATLIIIFR